MTDAAKAVARPTVLVTGASGGIGYEFAKVFAENGHDLALVARTSSRLDELAAELRGTGAEVTTIAMDLAKPGAADELLLQLDKAAVTVDVLVNNAGFAAYGPFSEIELENELEMIQLNVVTLTHLTKLVLPGMLERGSGRILNVASTAAFQPGPLMAVYYATKAFVLSFSEALAEELQGSGVHVTALCPGPTESGFQRRAAMEDSKIVQRKLPDARSVAFAGYKGMMAGKRIVIPGMGNKALATGVRFMPRSLITKAVKRAQERTS